MVRRLPLAPAIERLKQARSVKLNDVVLAVVAGAMRRFAAVVDVAPKTLRTMIPVNVRGSGEASAEETGSHSRSWTCRSTRPDPAARLDRGSTPRRRS